MQTNYYYYYLFIRVFHISISWWSFTGDWVTASLLKSPGLFSVFWPSSMMLLFGWSPLGCRLPNLPAPITIGIIVTFMFHSFFQFSSKVEVLISLFIFFQFYSVVGRDIKVDSFADFIFCFFVFLLIIMALFCAAIRKDSVFLLKFPFLSHVQVLSREMLFISRLKRPWNCFSSHFCFLVFVILLSIVLSVLFLMAVISPLLCFST